jgi:hypothetical protein
MKKAFKTLIQYLSIFIPMGVLIVFFTLWLGELLGDLLIGFFGDSLGLFIRPVVISGIVIALLYGLSMPLLVKTNQLIWFKRFKAEQINAIYRRYIYGIGSFAFLTTLVILNTYLALIASINWFNAGEFLIGYLLVLLVVIPAFCMKKSIDKNSLLSIKE